MVQGFSDSSTWAPVPPERPAGNGPAPQFSSTGPYGHRKRMRERILSRGAATIADYEVLEMLLFLGIPLGDTKPLAKATINRFGSLPAVLRASRETLRATAGLTEKCAEAIALVQDTCPRITAAEPRDSPVLSNWPSLRAYLATTPPAPLRVLYLDNKNRLLADEPLDGVTVETAIPRTILRRALELHSVSLLLATWRTDPASTRADREFLPRLRAAGAAVSVGAHDLCIVTTDELISVQQDL
jgi:DNA repair protein RadC